MLCKQILALDARQPTALNNVDLFIKASPTREEKREEALRNVELRSARHPPYRLRSDAPSIARNGSVCCITSLTPTRDGGFCFRIAGAERGHVRGLYSEIARRGIVEARAMWPRRAVISPTAPKDSPCGRQTFARRTSRMVETAAPNYRLQHERLPRRSVVRPIEFRQGACAHRASRLADIRHRGHRRPAC